MSRNLLLKTAFVVVLVVVSVYIKVAIQLTKPDLSHIGPQTIDAFLASNGFHESSVTQTASGVHVNARRAECDVVIKDIAPQGWDESTMQVLATGKTLKYVTGGTVYQDRQPVWRTWFSYRLWRILNTMGIHVHKTLVFGVAESPGCAALNIDWSGLDERVVAQR